GTQRPDAAGPARAVRLPRLVRRRPRAQPAPDRLTGTDRHRLTASARLTGAGATPPARLGSAPAVPGRGGGTASPPAPRFAGGPRTARPATPPPSPVARRGAAQDR